MELGIIQLNYNSLQTKTLQSAATNFKSTLSRNKIQVADEKCFVAGVIREGNFIYTI